MKCAFKLQSVQVDESQQVPIMTPSLTVMEAIQTSAGAEHSRFGCHTLLIGRADNLKQTAGIQAEELRHSYCSTRTEMLEKLSGLIYWVE